ncbi:YdeI/OmpD-associated family protein [Lactiplantibacillus plantarum]|uniref:YdeI/OmpD-associated family protein n=1 Tax=Lactiplantibacillus plantarum TaxID=1590 RepID=UPI00325C5874
MSTAPLSSFGKNIPAVTELLAVDAELQTFFVALTPGYQREWARFIFGTKAQATKERHIEVMKTVFRAGYKSKRAYDSRPDK